MSQLREVVVVGIVLGAAIAALAQCAGCSGSQAANDAAVQIAADKAYAAEHLWCVERHNTNAEIDACREEVRRRWGITTTVRDAGGDR